MPPRIVKYPSKLAHRTEHITYLLLCFRERARWFLIPYNPDYPEILMKIKLISAIL